MPGHHIPDASQPNIGVQNPWRSPGLWRNSLLRGHPVEGKVGERPADFKPAGNIERLTQFLKQGLQRIALFFQLTLVVIENATLAFQLSGAA